MRGQTPRCWQVPRRTECGHFTAFKGAKVFPSGSVVKNSPAKQEMQVQPQDWEDPLEKEMATYPSILAWEIPWTEEPGRL